MALDNLLLTFRDELTIRVCDLREHVSQFVHELPTGQNSKRHLDGEDSETTRVILTVSEHQPGGEQARGLVHVDVLTWGQPLVEAGVEAGQQGLHAGAAHQGPGLQSVEAVLSEGLDHIPDVDMLKKGSPLDIAELGRCPVSREPDVIMLLEGIVQTVELAVTLPVVVSIVVAGAVIHDVSELCYTGVTIPLSITV